MIIYPFKGKEPEISESAYIAENAVVTGDVKIRRLNVNLV